MKLNYKKSLKLITLLISSLLIATVSAQVYTQMFLNATIGVKGLSLKWEQGTNSEITPSIIGSSCSLSGLGGYPGQTATYNDTVRITNAGSMSVTFNITVQTCSGSTNNLTSIYVKLYNGTDSSLIDTLTVWASGSKGSPLTDLQIPSGEYWKLSWEITWSNNAVTSDSVNVDLVLDVTS